MVVRTRKLDSYRSPSTSNATTNFQYLPSTPRHLIREIQLQTPLLDTLRLASLKNIQRANHQRNSLHPIRQFRLQLHPNPSLRIVSRISRSFSKRLYRNTKHKSKSFRNNVNESHIFVAAPPTFPGGPNKYTFRFITTTNPK